MPDEKIKLFGYSDVKDFKVKNGVTNWSLPLHFIILGD
jgi:hypothetical protein